MPRPRLHTDADVLAAVRKTFRATGHQTPVRELARSAGVSPAILYQRFGDKNGLFFRALEATRLDTSGFLARADEDIRGHVFRVADTIFDHFVAVFPDILLLWTHPNRADLTTGIGREELLGALEAALKQYGDSASSAARLLLSAAIDHALETVTSDVETSTTRKSLYELCGYLSISMQHESDEL